jgi:uncharacterized membrane protein
MVHLSVVYNVPFIVACLLPLFYIVLARPFSGSKQQFLVKSSLLFLLTIIGFLSWFYLDHSIIYLPPILMIMAILYPFIRSVMPEQTPLITRIYQLTKKENDPTRMSYTDKLTKIWIVFMILLLLNTFYLTFYASLETWSLFTNFINYLLMLSLFVAEWLFRIYWFHQWESPIEFAKQLLTLDQRELFR